MARLEGFEPPTGCLEGSCSVRLSYRRSRLIVPGAGYLVGQHARVRGRCSPGGHYGREP
jgi:hypothetical protein